jgi:ribosomal protein S15P/S13E
MAEVKDQIRIDPEVMVLRLNKEGGYNYRERRQEDWRENYTLARDKVTINRLTQRQTVNIPLMKTVLKTIIKDIDDMPVLFFENLDNNKEAEVFKNEYWKWTVEKNKMEIKDIVDKKQELQFGRTFDQMQIIDGMVNFTIVDPEDMLVDRYCDPTNIDNARFLIHTHIFVPLSVLVLNKDYDQDKIAELKMWHASDQGLIKSKTNTDMLVEKNQRLADMGLQDVEEPILGETYVELSMHFVYDKKDEKSDPELYLKVEADDMKILLNKPLDEVIGKTKDNYWKTHLPYNTWADDVENQDFWSDGIADTIRQPNKVLNAWFSQMVENRTLRNLNMNIYDSTAGEGFAPETWQPQAWGWYGVPGKPSEVYQQMQVADLTDSLDEMQFAIQMVEKASGATTTQQGVQTERQITLGEVQLALGEAKERIKGMSKYYTQVWKDRGEKFIKMVEASPEKLDAVKIYKTGRNSNNIFEREITPKDWQSDAGYEVKVWSQDEKNEQDTQSIEKLSAVRANMPDNPKLAEVFQRKLLEFAGLKPDEINEIMEFEETKREAIISQLGNEGITQPLLAQNPQPQQPRQPVRPTTRPVPQI